MSRRDAPPPSPARAALPGWLGPKVLLPVVAILGLATIAAGVLVALGVNGDTKTVHELATCNTATDPNCKLRRPTHQHANFALVIDGKAFDFSQPPFVSSEGAERSGYVHIHAPRYNVVHVHQTGTTWAEFFAAIGFGLKDPTLVGIVPETTCLTLPTGEKPCTANGKKLQFVVNGVKVDGISEKEITDLDRVLIAYGTEDEAGLLKLWNDDVPTDACIPSLRCLEKVPPNEPKEPCQGGEGSGECAGS